MSLARANGASRLLSLAAEIRCNIWFMLFQHAYLWFPYTPALCGKHGTMDNEIANLMSILYTCKTINTEATAILTSNLTVGLDTEKQRFQSLHLSFRENVLPKVHCLTLPTHSMLRQPRDLIIVLDAATSLNTLIFGCWPLGSHPCKKASELAEYVHDGPFGAAPRSFDNQAQTLIEKFRDTLDHASSEWANTWRRGRLERSQR